MTGIQSDAPAYRHEQEGPWGLVMYAVAAALLTVSWCVQNVPALAITFGVTGCFMVLLAASMRRLTVADEGEQLAVRFGPFPLFRRRIWYDDIVEAEKGRTTFLDGWGIHWIPWSGWVWNIWGYDCIVLRLKRGTLKIGTDDPDGLVAFLTARIGKGHVERDDDPEKLTRAEAQGRGQKR